MITTAPAAAVAVIVLALLTGFALGWWWADEDRRDALALAAEHEYRWRNAFAAFQAWQTKATELMNRLDAAGLLTSEEGLARGKGEHNYGQETEGHDG